MNHTYLGTTTMSTETTTAQDQNNTEDQTNKKGAYFIYTYIYKHTHQKMRLSKSEVI